MFQMYQELKKYFKPMKWIILAYFFLMPTLSYYQVFVSTKIGSVINSWTGRVPDFNILFSSILFIGCLYLVQAIWQFINWTIAEYLFKRAAQNMKSDMFRHISKLPITYFDQHTTGTIMERAYFGIKSLTPILFSIPVKFISSIVSLIATAIAMFQINAHFAILNIILAPMTLIISLVFVKILKKYERKSGDLQDYTTTISENAISGIKTVKIFTNEEKLSQDFERLSEEKFKNDFKKSKIDNTHTTLDFLVQALLQIVSLFYGGYLVASQVISIGDLVSFQLLLTTLLNPIQKIASLISEFASSSVAFERFQDILKTEEEPMGGETPLNVFEKSIVFKNVSFAYPQLQELSVLKNVSFEIKKGSNIAFVGLSGSGKSTIISLLMEFYPIEKGSILVDNKSITDYQVKSIREKIGLVQQETFIFADTIKNNILFGKPDASDEEIYAALKKAQLEEFVQSLPKGIDTLVGDKGITLSGGQKQRIAIARVFLEDPEILILDEATSSLDNKTEKEIQKMLNDLSKSRTTITIAHRLSTIIDADIIYVLNQGKIVESGSHNDLLDGNSLYKTLYDAQKSQKEVEN